MQDQNSNSKSQNQNQSAKADFKYRAFNLSIAVIRFLGSFPKDQTFHIISGQLIRSITSIGANIVEAKSSSSKKEFLNYFQIALKSSNETKYWLAMLKELYPQKKNEIDTFIREVQEISKIIGSSVLTMKGKRSL